MEIKCTLCPNLETNFDPVNLTEHIRAEHMIDVDYLKCTNCDYKTDRWSEFCRHAVDTKHKVGSMSFDLPKFVNSSYRLKKIFEQLLDCRTETTEFCERSIENPPQKSSTAVESSEENELSENVGFENTNEPFQIFDEDDILPEKSREKNICNEKRPVICVTNVTATVSNNKVVDKNIAVEREENDDDVVLLEVIPPPKRKRTQAANRCAAWFETVRENMTTNSNFQQIREQANEIVEQVVSRATVAATKSDKPKKPKNSSVPVDTNVENERKIQSMRWYKCSVCDNVFRPYELRKHTESHWAPRLWGCKLCDFDAVDKSSIVLHSQIEHKLIDNKKLKLPILKIDRSVFSELILLKTAQCFPQWKNLRLSI